MEATDASAQPALDAKVLRKGLKARIPYLLAHKEDLTPRELRRLLESDLHLAAKTLDEAPWKAQVTAHLDEVLTKVQELETSPKEEAPAKRKTKARADEAPAKKAKAPKAKEEPPQPGSSAHLTALLRSAGIPIPPAVYTKAKAAGAEEAAEEALHAGLLALLEAEGLDDSSDKKALQKVKERRELKKDLEGISEANVVSGPRGRRGAAAAHAPAFVPVPQGTAGDDSDEF